MIPLEMQLKLSVVHLELLRIAAEADNDTALALRRSAALVALAADDRIVRVPAGSPANDNGAP